MGLSIENINKLKELHPKIIKKLSAQNIVFNANELMFMRVMYKEITGSYANTNCSSCLKLYKGLNNYLNQLK